MHASACNITIYPHPGHVSLKVYSLVVLVPTKNAIIIKKKYKRKTTDVDKFNEILASKADFRFVHHADGHFQSFVHGRPASG